MYNFVIVMVYFRFCKIIFVCKLFVYVHVLLLFFSNKLVVGMYNFVIVMVCFRFCKIVLVCKLLKLC